MELKELIGKQVVVVSPWITSDPENVESVILHGVELAGIWIERPETHEAVLKRGKTTMEDSTPIIFLPFHKIEAIVSEIPKTMISDRLAE